MDGARDALMTANFEPDLPWFDYYDSTRHNGFAGYATLRAGRFQESRARLADALGGLPGEAVKQRAVSGATLRQPTCTTATLTRHAILPVTRRTSCSVLATPRGQNG